MQAHVVKISDSVRLLQDIPRLGLHCGDVGVVCSTWFGPEPSYEVEFQPPGTHGATRALVSPAQIQVTCDEAASKLRDA